MPVSKQKNWATNKVLLTIFKSTSFRRKSYLRYSRVPVLAETNRLCTKSLKPLGQCFSSEFRINWYYICGPEDQNSKEWHWRHEKTLMDIPSVRQSALNDQLTHLWGVSYWKVASVTSASARKEGRNVRCWQVNHVKMYYMHGSPAQEQTNTMNH